MSNIQISGAPPVGLAGRNIIVGITGGIAAYKAPALVRALTSIGANVQVVMSASAHQFVTATTLQAVSGRPVRDDLWDEGAEAAMGHIELARWADAIMVAPATANFLAELAAGLAGDLLSTLCLATDAPILIAPAMNQAMWKHPATARNVATLINDGVGIIGPGEGAQACGDFGPGRMLEPDALVGALEKVFAPPILEGLRVMITAGPTREAIDPVRYISNHSSGKQGFAIAAAAARSGADVTLICGPTNLPTPQGCRRIDINSAQDLFDAVQADLPGQHIFIGVAAVADYRPLAAAEQKIKKQVRGSNTMTLELTENPDVIASVAQAANPPLVVGFAAETQNALPAAREKRLRKQLDAIVVNDVSQAGIGFNSDHNAATLIWDEGELALQLQSKDQLAQALLDQLVRIFVTRLALPNHASASI
ncbi:MAG: bifunctional phosphopantothenoylcysteine decarboxylase/phosphopantothenate--cysteine ligase CoaBC [Proteobacteria bacterium]|nr:bifunctional phosphopantothenoylcysteine decarboxylase/phosphopantothenate--cysteine ligase CoaBC [Pseudomonadota bacterium]